MLTNGKLTVYGAIYGKTDEAIAETATFFWSQRQSVSENGKLFIGTHVSTSHGYHFDFAAFQAEQFARIMDSNPSRQLEIHTGTWSPEQSVVLATRPYPINLKLAMAVDETRCLTFTDDGTAFVDELQKRQSSFGYLFIECEWLLKLEYRFEKLGRWCLAEECILLPFAAPMHALLCHIDTADAVISIRSI
jgi:hypothetical protein